MLIDDEMLLALLLLTPFQDADHWRDAALEHEFAGQFDEAVIARARGLVESDDEQERRELTRLTKWLAELEFTFRLDPPEGSEGSPLYEPPALDAAAGRIVTAWRDLRIWDEVTGELLFEPIELEAIPDAVWLDPTGKRAAVMAAQSVTVWDVEHGQQLMGPIDVRGAVVWGSRGDNLALVEATAEGVRLVLWDVEQASPRFSTPEYLDWIYSVALSSDGRFLAYGIDRSVIVCDLGGDPSTPVKIPEVDGDGSLCFHPSEQLLAISDLGLSRLRVWNVASAAWDSPWMPGPAFGFGPYGSPDPTLVFDVAGDRWVATDGGDVFASRAIDGRPAGLPLVKDDLKNGVHSLSPGGRYFASAGLGGSIRVWDTFSGERLNPVLYHGSGVDRLTFTDAGRLVSSSRNGVVRVWSTERLGGRYVPADDHAAKVYLAEGSPFAVQAVLRGVLRVVNSEGRDVHRFDCPARLTGLAVSSDGSRLAGMGQCDGAWTWDLGETEPRSEAVTLTGHGLALVVCVRSSCELFEVHSFSRKARERSRSRSYFKLLQRHERSNGAEQFARTSDARH